MSLHTFIEKVMLKIKQLLLENCHGFQDLGQKWWLLTDKYKT